MTRKPDRFERMVSKARRRSCEPGTSNVFLIHHEIVALLRREHRAVVRVVKNEVEHVIAELSERADFETNSRAILARAWIRTVESNILAALAKRAR